MDPSARAAWRERLRVAHGNWCCEVCKTSYASQKQFEWRPGLTDIVRHSECGHVITYRSGRKAEIEQAIADMEVLVHMAGFALDRAGWELGASLSERDLADMRQLAHERTVRQGTWRKKMASGRD